ncbi:MAG: hypothetical protein ACLUIR_06010 [Faecalibacterium prausnitzii]
MLGAAAERGDDYLEIARAIYDRVMPQRSADERSAFFRVLGRCRSYAWPGNVRELTNTVRVSLLLPGQPGGRGVPVPQDEPLENRWICSAAGENH